MFTNNRVKLFVLVSSLLIVVLSVMHTMSGPRLVGSKQIGSLADTTFVVTFNTKLADNVLDITVEPAVAYEATIQSNMLRIKIKESLQYSQVYSIRASVSDKRNRRSTVTMKFTTAKQQIAFLRRMYDGEPDEIYKKTVGEDKETLLYADFNIDNFAINNRDEIAIISNEETESNFGSVLKIVKDNKSKILQAPKGSPISVASTRATSLFAVKTQDLITLENFLFVYDAENEQFTEITNGDGSSVHASDVLFAPDGRTLIFQNARDNAIYIDELFDDRGAFSFGIAIKIVRYMPDNSGLYIEKQFSEYEFVNPKGDRVPDKTSISVIEQYKLLDNKGFVRLEADYSTSVTKQSLIVMSNDDVISQITSSADEKLVSDVLLSPNDEFVVVNETQQPVIFDGYRYHPAPKNNYLLIRNQSGQTIDSVRGIHLKWL